VIALDTSSLSAYLSGAPGSDVDAVDAALRDQQAWLPPAVLTEVLSDATLPTAVTEAIKGIPVLPLLDGYWLRAGELRGRVLSQKRRAPLADTLIAQSCLDHDVALITRDRDFQGFAKVSRLKILPIPNL
jgi:predicted nucleic acid-binding protein